MAITVQSTTIYPCKGLQGIPRNSIMINPSYGIIGDRTFAFAKPVNKTDEKVYSAGWQRKGAFFVAMNTPEMAAIQIPQIPDGEEITEELLWRLVTNLDLPIGTKLLDYRDAAFNLTDTDPAETPTVSLLNAASLRSLGGQMGTSVDFRRFRMNIVVDGLAAWQELDWAQEFDARNPMGTQNAEISIGEVRFKVFDACERCKAIEANPETGERDGSLLSHLSVRSGHAGYESPQRNRGDVMGVLLKPLNSGRIYVGDKLVICQ
ncbi:MAG: MOSC domain-containing protein [Alphaproteobacteria bacterium]|nr:MOSC domain-containing protein [Alphaproteobacteria bacterium]MDD9920520.1 MOSC domain-containing protein [Alphaproteobacteria bacterium]